MAETWYLAICSGCVPVLPQPFAEQAERDSWVRRHRDGTGHAVTTARQDVLTAADLHTPAGDGVEVVGVAVEHSIQDPATGEITVRFRPV